MTLTVTPRLQKCIDLARHARGSRETARQAMDCFDLTSLQGNETQEDIYELGDLAQHNRLAAVCIYPEHVATAAKAIKRNGTVIATVINFPTGIQRTQTKEDATPTTTAEDIKSAVTNGTRQIDIVFPYEQFIMGNTTLAQKFLQAAREACPRTVTLKVILETAAFTDEKVLRQACKMAILAGADCLKTSTGKHAQGGVTMEAAAILLEEAHKANRKVGCKITGGIKTNDDCARYMTLARAIMGWNVVQPDLFRIGASKLLEDLLSTLGSKEAPAPTPVP